MIKSDLEKVLEIKWNVLLSGDACQGQIWKKCRQKTIDINIQCFVDEVCLIKTYSVF